MQKIDTIEIKNFKSIRHQKIEGCKRVNVFIGYPNTGKSNLLEAIGLFSSLRQKDEYFKFNDLCRVKHFSELFFNKDYREATNININNKLLLELIIIQSNDLSVRISTTSDREGNPDLDSIYSAEISNRDFNYKISRDTTESNYHYIVGSIRKYEFKSDGIINQQRPFTLAIPFGSNLLEVLQRDSNLRKEVASIFDTYDLKLFIDGEEIKFLKYLTDGTGVSIPYHQIADTLRRLIFYKASILSNKDSILLFEEPEAHMFPPYIAKFTTDIIFDENNNQYFISTHSPFILNDFMEDMDINDLSLYVVGLDNGETVVRRLNNDEMSEINQYGIDLFFNLESYLKEGFVNNA
jgi:AAA15 family ATPase/GTPase